MLTMSCDSPNINHSGNGPNEGADPFWQHSVTSGQPQQWQGRAGNPPGLTQRPGSRAARTLLRALLAHEQSDGH